MNCHVVSAGSLLQLLDNFVDAALEEGVPQVKDLRKETHVKNCKSVKSRFVGTGLPTPCSPPCPGLGASFTRKRNRSLIACSEVLRGKNDSNLLFLTLFVIQIYQMDSLSINLLLVLPPYISIYINILYIYILPDISSEGRRFTTPH